MSTSTPAKTEPTSRPPSPQESPFDSGFASRGPIYLTGFSFKEDESSDDSVIHFKNSAQDDHLSDDNTTVVAMGDVDDLRAANAKLQSEVTQLAARLADMDELNNTVADLRHRMSTLTAPPAPAPGLDKLCDKLSELTTSMQQRSDPPRPLTHRGPSVTLPRFDGSVYSSFEKWQRDLETYFEYFNWPQTDPQRTNAIPTILDGMARVRYFELTNEQRANYGTVMTELSNSFSMAQKNLSFRRNYIRRKQKNSESVREFSADILQRFAECNPPLETQVDTYCSMLLPEIAAEIQDDNYTDMRSLVSSAERAEHRLHLRRQARESINPVSFRPRRNESRGRRSDRRDDRRDSRHRSSSRGGYVSRPNSRSRSRNDYSRSRSRGRSYNSPPPEKKRYSAGSRDTSAPRRSTSRYSRGSRDRSNSRPRQTDTVNAVECDNQDLN